MISEKSRNKMAEALTDGIRFEDITYAYNGDGDVLQGASGALEAGQVTVIDGPSGEGKSTLLKVIGGNLRQSAGEVWHGEEVQIGPRRRGLTAAVSELRTAAQLNRLRRERVVYIPQRPELVPSRRLGASLVDFASATAGTTPETRTLMGLLVDHDIVDQRDRLPGELSGGQEKRAAVAIGMAQVLSIKKADPDARPAILADEPMAGLDEQRRDTVMSALLDLADEGHVVGVVSHQEWVQSNAHSYMRLERGAIVDMPGSLSALPSVTPTELA